MSDKKISQREHALNIIKNGGAFMMKVDGQNKIFSAENIEQLPSDADMAIASGSPELSKMAAEDIDAQIEQLQAAKKKLAEQEKQQAKADDSKKAAKPEDEKESK